MSVYVVTGPPAGGKSTWVRAHAQAGDITIDYDALVAALAPGVDADPVAQPPHVAAVVGAARDAAIEQATRCTTQDVYIVHAMPSRQHFNRYQKHGAKVITIDPGYTECMRRAQAERTPRQVGIVHDWYDRRGLVA